MKFFALFAAGVSIASAAATPGCSSDNCARAVTGTVRGLVAQSSAKKDCESFFRSTVYPTIVSCLKKILGPTLMNIGDFHSYYYDLSILSNGHTDYGNNFADSDR